MVENMDILSRLDQKMSPENDREAGQASHQLLHCEFRGALLLRSFLFIKKGNFRTQMNCQLPKEREAEQRRLNYWYDL
jgi:hypothetical protein